MLGDTVFNQYAATAAAMEPGAVVAYARHHIRAPRTEFTSPVLNTVS